MIDGALQARNAYSHIAARARDVVSTNEMDIERQLNALR